MRAALGAPGRRGFSTDETARGRRCRVRSRASRGGGEAQRPFGRGGVRQHLASEAPGDHHFDADGDDAAHGVDAALAS